MTIDMELQTQQRLEQLIASLDQIATLPEVTARIIATVNDTRSTAPDLHRIISHDPALVTRILKLVNSAFYARANKIDSIERAIVLLGFDAIHNLAVAASLGQLFKNVRLCETFTARDLWTHCIAVGVTARAMATLIRKPLAESAFLAGLVHDVGLLVSLQLCRDKLQLVCETARRDATAFRLLEQDIIGADHEQLGTALARKWGFPAICQAVAAHHHHPAMADDDARILAAIVYVADTLCCQQNIGFNLTAINQSLDDPALHGLVPLPTIQSTADGLQGLVWTAVRIFG